MKLSAPRSALDRPAGLAPKGTSGGLGLLSVYGLGAPMAAAAAISSLLPGLPLLAMKVTLVLAPVLMALFIPLVVGMKSRRYWGVVLYFSVLLLYAVLVPAALLMCIVAVVLSRHLHTPNAFFSWFALMVILPQAAFYPFLIRTLRLKYWQPWTRPDQWEIGDERTPAWAYRIGVAPPPKAQPLLPPEPVAKPHAARRQHRPPR